MFPLVKLKSVNTKAFQGVFMAEQKIKTKDMIIAIFCTLLTILCIAFYFLPAFNVKHSTDGLDYTTVSYSGWEMTIATFVKTKYIGADAPNWAGLVYIKDTYGLAVSLAGVLMPLAIICAIVTTVFTYLAWLKGEQFKKYSFLFSLCGMIFQTITLISTWFIAMVTKDGNFYGFFGANLKGGMSYASFVSLILAFVIAIIACAYNYFLDNFDDEEEEEEEDIPKKKRVKYVEVDDDEEEEVVIVRRKKSSSKSEDDEVASDTIEKVKKDEV